MERLSSGKRINSGADDAAGLFITKRMAGEIQGLNQAVRNAADAQAYLATTEGALEEVHTILLRMRELAVQGGNGTYTAQDRQALRAEIHDLQTEIERISNDTTFNNLSSLNWSAFLWYNISDWCRQYPDYDCIGIKRNTCLSWSNFYGV